MPVFRASTRLLQGVTDDEPSVGLFDAHLLTGTSPLEVRVSAEDVRPRRDSAACIVQPDAAAPPCVSPRLDSHARRKSLKARARPSCRALDEQRVARRPTVPSVQHCPGADRARRHPPALLLIPSCQGRLVCSVGKLLSEMIWCLLLLVQCGRHGRRCAAWG